jgi:MFS family permease
MLLLGVGMLGIQFFWGFNTVSMPLFLSGFTDSKVKISLVLALGGVAGCIIPPLVGYFSDRTSGRFGRRRPYIFIGALGVSLCLLFLPRSLTYAGAALVAGLMYFFLRFAETPYLSLLPDITPPEQRSTASGVMNLLGSAGLISYFVIGGMVWQSNPAAAFYMVSLVLFAAILIALMLIKEPDALPEAPSEEAEGGGGPIDYLKGIMREKSAMRYFVAQFFWWLGFWIVTSFVALFVVEELNAPEADAFKVLAVFSIASTIFVLPLGILGDKVGRKGLLSIMIGFWGISEIAVGFSQNINHALLLVGFTAIPFAAVMGVGLAYLLDLIPPDRTAEFIGFSIISIALAQIFGPLVGGVLIDVFGYRSIFPATAAFMFIGLILLQFVKPRPGDTSEAQEI